MPCIPVAPARQPSACHGDQVSDGALYTELVPEGSSNPSDFVRGLEMLRSAFVSPGNVSDSLPAAVERAGEVRESLDRLTEEVATLNRNVERALPVIESFERQFERALPLLESIHRAERGIQQMMRRTFRRVREVPGDEDSAGGEAGGEAGGQV
jgi:hypothetical protein